MMSFITITPSPSPSSLSSNRSSEHARQQEVETINSLCRIPSASNSNSPSTSQLPFTVSSSKPPRSPAPAPSTLLQPPAAAEEEEEEEEEELNGRPPVGLAHMSLPPGRLDSMSPSRKRSVPRSPSSLRQRMVLRSLSLPTFRRLKSFSRPKSDVFFIRSLSINGLQELHDNVTILDVHSDEKEVPEEEAICRICMLELVEGNDMFRMECSCKGELALAHKGCAVKWFSVKGNNLCDICNSTVRNLPVLLFRRVSSLCRENASMAGDEDIDDSSSWGHTVVILLSSALASFWHRLQELSEFP